MRGIDFEKKWFYRRLRQTNKIKKMGVVLTLKLMEKHSIATEKNQFLKIYSEQIEFCLQIYVGHIIIKQTW